MPRFPILFLPVALAGSLTAVVAGPLPERGDRFAIHQETVFSGTESFEGSDPEPFHQRVEAWGTASVRNSDPGKGVEIRYAFDRAVFELAVEGQGSSRFEVLPSRVILDGTAIYDREKNADLPVGLLDLVINEEFLVRLSPNFEVEEIRQFRRNRSERSFFDLLSIVRETLVPHPPDGIGVGEAWGALRPLEALGGDFTIPATETFRYNQAPLPGQPIRTLQRSVQASLENPRAVKIRMGLLAKGNLAYDALGPNLIAPPPNWRIHTFEFDSRGVIEFDVDWGFVRTSGSMADISLECEVPPPDGVTLRKKRLELFRETLLTVEKLPDLDLTEEEKTLLFGPERD